MEVGGPNGRPTESVTMNATRMPADVFGVMWLSVDGELVRVPRRVTEVDGGVTTYEGRMEAREGKLTVTVYVGHDGPGTPPVRVVEWAILQK